MDTYTSSDEEVCVWPDGTWCYFDNLEEFLGFMSDDFYTLPADEFFAKRPNER